MSGLIEARNVLANARLESHFSDGSGKTTVTRLLGKVTGKEIRSCIPVDTDCCNIFPQRQQGSFAIA